MRNNSLKIAQQRYFQSPTSSWEKLSIRVAKGIAYNENSNYERYEKEFYDIINNYKFIPGGRILRNTGRGKAQNLLNCFVIPIDDNIQSIGQCMKDSLITWAGGGGIGINFSTLRPKGAGIKGRGGESSGLVSFMTALDAVADTIRIGGQRRAATIAIVEVSHPEIEEFIDAKLKYNKLGCFNISVGINNTFLEAVERDAEWELVFRNKVYKTIKAKELWKKILRNMIACAEPGIINMDKLTKANSYYFNPIIGTNPCVTGDTEIKTIYGNKKIVELVGKEIPVYCWGKEKGIQVRMMRRIRKTRTKAKILKISFDDNTAVKVTKDHGFYNVKGNIIEAKELKVGDSVKACRTKKRNKGDVVYKIDSYSEVNYRIIAEWKYGRVLKHSFRKKMGALRNPITKRFNHKVVKIEEVACEDVYNGIVDEYHNYILSNNVISKNCGELPLGQYGSCCLGALVLPKFLRGTQTWWQELEKVIRTSVRFLDNVIDITSFPTSQMKEVAENERRIGLGVMGLADYFFQKQIRYGSEESIIEVERLFKFVRNIAYDESIELAKEKGVFPKFDVMKYSKASFVKKLPVQIRRKIKEHGIRNVALLTCAPTGTTSLVGGVSSGIEPLFSKAYKRSDQLGTKNYIHSIYNDILVNNKETPDWFVDSYDLTPEEHFEMQATIQRYIDGAISKTINCSANTTVDQLSTWLLEYAYDLKGVTIYRDKSRKEQVLYPLTRKDVKRYLKEEAK